jgi:hypothetical protein
MRCFALSLLLVAGCQWAYDYDDGLAALMMGCLAAGCLVCYLNRGLFMRLLGAASW